MGFSGQEYCNVLPFPTPGYLPDLRIKPVSSVSLALPGRFFTTEPPEKSFHVLAHLIFTISLLHSMEKGDKETWRAQAKNYALLPLHHHKFKIFLSTLKAWGFIAEILNANRVWKGWYVNLMISTNTLPRTSLSSIKSASLSLWESKSNDTSSKFTARNPAWGYRSPY